MFSTLLEPDQIRNGNDRCAPNARSCSFPLAFSNIGATKSRQIILQIAFSWICPHWDNLFVIHVESRMDFGEGRFEINLRGKMPA
jgi:hypothetical protein